MSRESTSKPNQEEPPSQEEIDSLAESLEPGSDMKKYDLITLQCVLSAVRDKAKQDATNENYDKAFMRDELAQSLSLEIRRKSYENECQMDNLKKEEIEKSQKRAYDSWEKKFEEFNKDSDARWERLTQRQQEVMDDFETEWATKKPKVYDHPTNQLLTLRYIEKQSASAGQYKYADMLIKERKDLEGNEVERNQLRLDHDYEFNRNHMILKFKEERKLFCQNREHKAKLLQMQMEREFNIIEKKKENMAKKEELASRGKPKYSPMRFYLLSKTKDSQSVAYCEEYKLPRLKAPNDDSYVEEKKKKEQEEKEKQQRRSQHLQGKSQIPKFIPVAGKRPAGSNNVPRTPQQNRVSQSRSLQKSESSRSKVSLENEASRSKVSQKDVQKSETNNDDKQLDVHDQMISIMQGSEKENKDASSSNRDQGKVERNESKNLESERSVEYKGNQLENGGNNEEAESAKSKEIEAEGSVSGEVVDKTSGAEQEKGAEEVSIGKENSAKDVASEISREDSLKGNNIEPEPSEEKQEDGGLGVKAGLLSAMGGLGEGPGAI